MDDENAIKTTIPDIAKLIFDPNIIGTNRRICLVSSDARPVTIFSIMLEILITGHNIMYPDQFINSTHLSILKPYIKILGYNLMTEVNFYNDSLSVVENRHKSDTYVELVPKPPQYLQSKTDWYVANTRIINNNDFIYSSITPLKKFGAIIIDNDSVIRLHFEVIPGFFDVENSCSRS